MLKGIKQKITDYIDSRAQAVLSASAQSKEPTAEITPARRLTSEEAQQYLNLSFQRDWRECFKRYVNKDGKVAMDALGGKTPKCYGLEGLGQDIIYTFFAKHGFIGWQLCAMLSQQWLIHKACTMPNEDAMRPGWENSFDTENEEHHTDLLARLKQKSVSDYHLAQKCVEFGNNRKIFGIGIAFPVVEGADTSVPFNPDSVTKGRYKGITVIDPYWCLPSWSEEAMSEPGSLHFYEPEYYSFPFASGVKKVHRSHLIISLNAEVPDILKPSYYFGGIPLPQMIYERVYAAEKVANEAPLLALTKRLLVADGHLEEMYLHPEVVKEKMRHVTELRDNFGVFVKNPGEEVQQIDTTLTDFDQLIMTQYQLVSSIAGIPKYKLFGTDLKGFNATGEGETKNYIQSLQSLQENVFKPLIDRHNLLSLRSDFESKERVSVKFNPVDMPTEKELAEVEALKAQTDTAYVNAGILSPEEVREKVAADKSNSYNSLSEELPADLDLEEGAFHEGENTPEFEFNIGDEAVGMDPFPNEHAARVKDPDDFEKGSFRRKNLAKGVDVILGRLKSSGEFVPQTYRFKSADFTAAQAKAWLEKHKVGQHGFEAASDVLDAWEERKHPRKDNGQFGQGSSGAGQTEHKGAKPLQDLWGLSLKE